jgi:hypothetical protein
VWVHELWFTTCNQVGSQFPRQLWGGSGPEKKAQRQERGKEREPSLHAPPHAPGRQNLAGSRCALDFPPSPLSGGMGIWHVMSGFGRLA